VHVVQERTTPLLRLGCGCKQEAGTHIYILFILLNFILCLFQSLVSLVLSL